MDSTQLQQTLSVKITSYYDVKIQEAYPYLKVIQVLLGNEGGLEEMKSYFQEAITERDALLAICDDVASSELPSTFVSGEDGAMADQVRGYFPTLNERQRSAIIDAFYTIE